MLLKMTIGLSSGVCKAFPFVNKGKNIFPGGKYSGEKRCRLQTVILQLALSALRISRQRKKFLSFGKSFRVSRKLSDFPPHPKDLSPILKRITGRRQIPTAIYTMVWESPAEGSERISFSIINSSGFLTIHSEAPPAAQFSLPNFLQLKAISPRKTDLTQMNFAPMALPLSVRFLLLGKTTK